MMGDVRDGGMVVAGDGANWVWRDHWDLITRKQLDSAHGIQRFLGSIRCSPREPLKRLRNDLPAVHIQAGYKKMPEMRTPSAEAVQLKAATANTSAATRIARIVLWQVVSVNLRSETSRASERSERHV